MNFVKLKQKVEKVEKAEKAEKADKADKAEIRQGKQIEKAEKGGKKAEKGGKGGSHISLKRYYFSRNTLTYCTEVTYSETPLCFLIFTIKGMVVFSH